MELNVLAQVFYVKQQDSVAEAIRDRGVQVHGFVFNTDSRECVRLLMSPR